MSNWPIATGALPASGLTGPVSVTGPTGSTFDPGPWHELLASAPAGVAGLRLTLFRQYSQYTTTYYDLGVGEAGAESPIVEGLPFSASQYQVCGMSLDLPVAVPAGARLAIRYANASAAGSLTDWRVARAGITPLLHTGLMESAGGRLRAIGYTRANASAITVPIGPAWVEVTNNSPRLRGFCLVLAEPESGASVSVAYHTIAVAVGAAGSETVVLPPVEYAINERTLGIAMIGPFWTTIPAGSRVAVRSQFTHGLGAATSVRVIIQGIE